MDVTAHAPLRAALIARRAAIADRWYRAVVHSGFAPFSGREVRARLLALTDRAIAALLAEPFEPTEARAIGSTLAALHYLDPAALESTLVVLGRELLADVPPAALPLFSPRLTTLLGALARGYYVAARATILAEQEAARAPQLAEQRRVEAALRASAARLRAVVTNSPVMIFALDRAGVFTLAEGKGLAALGLTPEAIVGRAVEELFAAVPTLVRDVRRALAGENCTAIVGSGGIVIEARHTPERDAAGAIIGAIGVATDITERTRAEAALRASEERLHEAVDHAPLILFTLDRAGVVTFAAGQGLATLGLTAPQVVGRSVFVAGQRFPGVLDNVRRVLAGEAFDAVVAIGRHTFSTHYAPLHDDSGAITGAIGVAANSTRRVRAEATVRRYAAGLTPHEQEVLALLATDLTHREIAARLNIGYETVRMLLRRIAAKLDLGTAARAAVIVAARARGLLT